MNIMNSGDVLTVHDLAEKIYEAGYERCKKENGNTENSINQINYESGYNQGVNDTWECIKKLFMTPTHGGMGYNELNRLFGSAQLGEIATQNSIQQIMKKVSAWNEENKPTVENVITQLERVIQTDRVNGWNTDNHVLTAIDMLKKIKEEQ